MKLNWLKSVGRWFGWRQEKQCSRCGQASYRHALRSRGGFIGGHPCCCREKKKCTDIPCWDTITQRPLDFYLTFTTEGSNVRVRLRMVPTGGSAAEWPSWSKVYESPIECNRQFAFGELEYEIAEEDEASPCKFLNSEVELTPLDSNDILEDILPEAGGVFSCVNCSDRYDLPIFFRLELRDVEQFGETEPCCTGFNETKFTLHRSTVSPCGWSTHMCRTCTPCNTGSQASPTILLLTFSGFAEKDPDELEEGEIPCGGCEDLNRAFAVQLSQDGGSGCEYSGPGIAICDYEWETAMQTMASCQIIKRDVDDGFRVLAYFQGFGDDPTVPDPSVEVVRATEEMAMPVNCKKMETALADIEISPDIEGLACDVSAVTVTIEVIE